MIILLHGDDILASRKALEEVKLSASSKEVLLLEGKTLDLTLLKQALEAQSLFAKEKLVVIENLITDNKKQTTDNALKYLAQGKFETDLVLWEGKTLPAKILSQFKKAKKIRIRLFKQPAIIFKLLDSLKPGNQEFMLSLFLNCKKKLEAEFIFYMLVRQFRFLLALKSGGKIEEVRKLASWQLGKLKRQAGFFKLNQLLRIYKELLVIDYQVKTGQSPLNLTKRIECFIINSL